MALFFWENKAYIYTNIDVKVNNKGNRNKQQKIKLTCVMHAFPFS